jgi:hypothetical protein
MSQFIEFDLRVEDFGRVLTLVNNLTEYDDHSNKLIQCDCFNENECHHSKKDHFMKVDLETCSYCRFVKLLRNKHSNIKVKNDSDNSITSNLQIRYKTLYYSSDALAWSEFQPWRSPYVLFCFATCISQQDLLNAIKNYEKLLDTYKKTLVSSKLFIDFHLKHEKNEIFLQSINETKSSYAQPKFLHSMSTPADFQNSQSNNTSIKDREYEIERFEYNLGISNGSIKTDYQEPSIRSSMMSLNEAVNNNNSSELEIKKKIYLNDIIYLDFLFASNGIEKLVAIVETEKNKIDSTVNFAMQLVFNKLRYLATNIDPNNEKQFLIYNDKLKTPPERTQTESDQSKSSSFLSIKIINKKLVSSRMAKYKADLCLSLNMMDTAFIYYQHAYNGSKKEQDHFWAVSALQGLCIVSYLFLKEHNRLQFKRQSTWSDVLCLNSFTIIIINKNKNKY